MYIYIKRQTAEDIVDYLKLMIEDGEYGDATANEIRDVIHEITSTIEEIEHVKRSIDKWYKDHTPYRKEEGV